MTEKTNIKNIIVNFRSFSKVLALVIALLALIISGCGLDEFKPSSYIESMRFLGVAPSPLEGNPGENMEFSALITNEDGTLYNGIVVWAVVSASMIGGEGQVEFDPSMVSGPTPASLPYVWPVPSVEELEKKYGGIEQNGLLLAVAAIALDENGDEKISLKTFAVSQRPDDQRLVNPNIMNFSVNESMGPEIYAGEDGIYETTAAEIVIYLEVDNAENVSYHWYAPDEEFTPSFAPLTYYKPAKKGLHYVYGVVRKAQTFAHDDATNESIMGIDWIVVPVRFL